MDKGVQHPPWPAQGVIGDREPGHAGAGEVYADRPPRHQPQHLGLAPVRQLHRRHENVQPRRAQEEPERSQRDRRDLHPPRH